MGVLKMDSFALEMREHYIATTLESLTRLESYDNFFAEFSEAIPEWMIEARSNEMNHFADLLESLGKTVAGGVLNSAELAPEICKVVREYLELLKSEEDSLALSQSYSQRLQDHVVERPEFYLQCIVYGQHLLLPVGNVIEILGHKKKFPLPLPQNGVSGLIPFRGQGIPVVNLVDFGFKAEDQNKVKTFFVVCEFAENFFALEIQGTDEVLEIKPRQFQDFSKSHQLLPPVIESFLVRDQRTLMLLDIKKVVGHE